LLLARCSSGGFAVYNNLMITPSRTSAAAFPRYGAGEVLADSAALRWKELFVQRYRFPNVVDRFLVPATPEPLISCNIAGSAEFREREIGEVWLNVRSAWATFSSPVQRRPMKYAIDIP